MILNLILIVVGVAVVLWGADRLTEGAVGIARRLRMSEMVIGLTIVAMGTSMPEFCVSLVSALKGTADLAVGNVVGSNIFNTLLIVGCAAAVAPMTVLPATVRKDMPFALVASAVLLLMCLDCGLSRLDGALLFALFLAFMVVTLRGARGEGQEVRGKEQEHRPSPHPLLSVAWIVVGLACLVGGSQVFVDNATQLASAFGVSEAVIGLTIVAGGTSLPELATSIVAARKGNSGIAIGNVLGSNVFNILMILGVTGIISPMALQGITWVDLSMLLVSMALLWLFAYTRLRIQRWEGWALVAVFGGYMAWLLFSINLG